MARKEVTQIRCSLLEKDKWRDAASAQGLELSAWMRHVLNEAAAGAPRVEVTQPLFPELGEYDQGAEQS